MKAEECMILNQLWKCELEYITAVQLDDQHLVQFCFFILCQFPTGAITSHMTSRANSHLWFFLLLDNERPNSCPCRKTLCVTPSNCWFPGFATLEPFWDVYRPKDSWSDAQTFSLLCTVTVKQSRPFSYQTSKKVLNQLFKCFFIQDSFRKWSEGRSDVRG